MVYVISFIAAFLIVYLFYFLTVILQKKKYDKFKKSNQVMYFVKKYKLDINQINIKKFIHIISFTNSLIIAFAFLATFLVENILLQLLIGLIVLIPLILISYSLIGNYLKRSVNNEYKRNRK